MVSCDAYNMNAEWLRLLLSEAENSGALCTVAQDSAGKLQPLCGVYHKNCLPVVSKALDDGRLRAMDLLRELDARAVKVNGMVLNLNTLSFGMSLRASTNRF
jgi:molybdopterin-guanine dinucleotide biosynthesis protein A